MRLRAIDLAPGALEDSSDRAAGKSRAEVADG